MAAKTKIVQRFIELTEPIMVLLTWHPLKSYGDNVLAMCTLSLTLNNPDYRVKVVKVPQAFKKEDVLCRCTRMGTQHAGNFALFDDENVVITLMLAGSMKTEITLATVQLVYRQAEQAIIVVGQQEMTIDIRREKEDHDTV